MRGTPFFFAGLTGGLNSRDSTIEVQPHQARDLLNVTGSVTGAIRKRDGNVLFASAPASIYRLPTTVTSVLSLGPDEATGTHYLVGQSGGDFFSVSGGAASTVITGTTTPTSGVRWEFIEAPIISSQGPVFAMNGTDTPQQWSGTGNMANWTATSGTLPNGKFVKYHANHVWVANMAAYTPSGGTAVNDPGSTLVFSAIGDPTSWPAANVVQFDPGDGDSIQGLGVVGPYLLVFKKHKTWVVTDAETGANRKVSEQVGCVAHRSIASSPLGAFFLGADGVYLTNGSKIELMSDIIRPTVANIVASQRQYAAGAFYNNHYYLSVCDGGSQNTITLDYDTTLQSWWKHSVGVNAWASWTPLSEQGLYSASASTSQVFQNFVPGYSSDNGAAYTAFWRGPWVSPTYFRRRIIQTPDYRKRLRQIRPFVTGNVTLQLAKDFTDSFSTVATYATGGAGSTFGGAGSFGVDGTFGDTSPITLEKAYSLGVGNAFSVQWISTTTLPWQVEEWLFFITDRTD